MLKAGDGTPWGRADYVKEIAPGLVLVGTPSHGGFWLAPERLAAMPAELAAIVPFVERSVGRVAGPHAGRWYEEDCDAALVVLAFPECFPREALESAHAIVRDFSPAAVVWLARLPASHPAALRPLLAPTPEGFELTGSDRPADAPGQGGLF